MPSLFGSGKKTGGRYVEVGQGASDSDEFSPSEDERVLFKKSGEIELNLYPQTRIKKSRYESSQCRTILVCVSIVVVMISLVVVGVVYSKNFGGKPSELKKTNPQTSQQESVDKQVTVKENGGWTVTYKEMAGEGSVRLMDVNQDGIDDIIFASSTALHEPFIVNPEAKTYDVLHKVCQSKGMDYPCMGNIIAVNGINGSHLWSMKARSETFTMNCEDFDVNKDGKTDCIATGRTGQIMAFDPFKGETLWMCEDDELFEANWNTYHAAALPDWDKDGVPEVLIANGGDMSKQPDDDDRAPGRLVVLSGASGKPVSKRYLEMPNSKETYMSPVMFTPTNGSTTYILIGSGGETIQGDLMGISVRDFCRYILEADNEVCGENQTDEYKGINKDENGIFVIYSGENKGIMVPPVIVDYDNDGVRDILVTSFEGINSLYNGSDLQLIWTANFSGMETYGTPAPGYFNDDEYIDFMVTWNYGVWMDYYSVYVYVISGKDGSVLWTLQSGFMQMSSSFSIATSLKHHDVFLFKVQGRDSKFKKTKEGLQRPNKKDRHKHHVSGGEGKPDIRPSTVEWRRKEFYRDFNCDDDLSTYRGEVFVLDRDTVKSPYRILDIPTKKHTYDAALKCNYITMSGGHGGTLNHLGNSDNHDDGIPVPDEDWKLNPEDSVDDDNDDDSDDLNIDDDHNENKDDDDDDYDGDDDNDDDDDANDNDDINNDDDINAADDDDDDNNNSNENISDTANDDDPSNGVEDDSVTTENKGMTQDTKSEDMITGGDDSSQPKGKPSTEGKKAKMCSVEKPDTMSSGIIGDVDGDGKLDYVSVTSAITMMYDAEYCPQGMTAELTVEKVDLEKGLLQGIFQQVPVNSKTSIKNTDVKSATQKEKIFLPMSEQRWTQYFATKDNNVYK